jgi:hypothetical protein
LKRIGFFLVTLALYVGVMSRATLFFRHFAVSAFMALAAVIHSASGPVHHALTLPALAGFALSVSFPLLLLFILIAAVFHG